MKKPDANNPDAVWKDRNLGFERVMNASFMSVGEEGNCLMMQNGGIMIELYQLPASPIIEIREREDGHIDHIAFDVENIDEAFSQFSVARIPVMEEQPLFLNFGLTDANTFIYQDRTARGWSLTRY
ncbi:hypothetical protein LZZ85_27260 [Terrimonas sp. NA20]|uniref:VOC family protein n=1 Tax=Terrimonas ginsenosidimutans TaxID=2908004 RepID=A0ABS9L0P0_9BACT|nr:hypothetical protein [Terrimonas ginsenosidimutans]MCG2618032.1 hypothetical protein [Terrimonas ginsenosidimutans]